MARIVGAKNAYIHALCPHLRSSPITLLPTIPNFAPLVTTSIPVFPLVPSLPAQPLPIHVRPLLPQIPFKRPLHHRRPTQIHLVVHICPSGHVRAVPYCRESRLRLGVTSCEPGGSALSIAEGLFALDEPRAEVREVARFVEGEPPEDQLLLMNRRQMDRITRNCGSGTRRPRGRSRRSPAVVVQQYPSGHSRRRRRI